MRSARFQKLEKGLDRVKALFLPAQRLTSGGYTPDDCDRSAAYIAMAHAEIQHYFDDKARELAQKGVYAFEQKGMLSREVISLISYLLPKDPFSRDPATALPAETRATTKAKAVDIGVPNVLAQNITRAAKSYEDDIRKKNNGIKSFNLMNLFLPLGLSATEFHPKWLAKMDDIGESRGNNVHKSLGSTIIGDPFEFFDDIERAMWGDPAWTSGVKQIASIASFDQLVDDRIRNLTGRRDSFSFDNTVLPDAGWKFQAPVAYNSFLK